MKKIACCNSLRPLPLYSLGMEMVLDEETRKKFRFRKSQLQTKCDLSYYYVNLLVPLPIPS